MKDIFYDLGGLNTQLFYVVNGIQGGEWYEKTMLLATWLGDHHKFPFYLLVFLLVAGVQLKYCLPPGRKAKLLDWANVIPVFIISYGVNGVIIKTLKVFFAFPRPFKALPEGSVHLIGPMMDVSKHYESFPSGHASFAMLIVASLWPILPKSGKITGGVFVLFVGISRLALGVHFPVDIFTGYLFCLLVVVLVRYGWGKVAVPMIEKKYG